MGSASSKFKKHVQNGDEFAAMQIFQSTPELRKSLDPNLSYGDSHHHNTALHFAAKHSMKHLLRTFLNDLGGNPNKKNAFNETSLHCACQPNQKSYSAEDRRVTCVNLLLQWRGITLNSGEREKVDLVAQDQKGNTALHCAALAGFKRCVELLLANGAPLFIENNDKLTPCDVAMKNEHHEIAQLLETHMVFAENSDIINEAELYTPEEQEEVYSGLRTQDLQEAKDQLLVETSDMLHIPLFTAEALLRDNEWSREMLLEKWMKDPVQCCQLAGVQPPASALQQVNSEAVISTEDCSGAQFVNDIDISSDTICEICTMAMPCWNQSVPMTCNHRFCTSCWKSYLTVKIQEGDAHHIFCPAFECPILVPVDVIERLVSPDMARRYLQFDIKAFVESNPSIKWCPRPGCGRAVRLPETEQAQSNEALQNTPPSKAPPITSHAVDCGNGHFFCWECLGEAHAPCGCSQWQQWQQKISEVKPEELKTSCLETENAANCLWLVTNSKPCPNCKSPIQKNEGCNHMKCSKCKFDFCWVCLENWKKHSSATGGYFRCNRFEAVHRADEKQGILISEATMRNQQMRELNRFLHYYTRFRNHENSQKLEEPLLNNVKQKMEILASSLEKSSKGEESTDKSTKFVEDGVRELLKARRVLCGSYVYGYYLEDNGYQRTIFEFMQNEFEEVTEKLSEMVARLYLRTPRSVIIQTTLLARRKRHEFVRAVSKGLIPPETPPPICKVRNKRFPALFGIDPANDEQMSRAIAASLMDIDCTNPWVRDPQSHNRNLDVICNWHGLESDEDDSAVNHALRASLMDDRPRRIRCETHPRRSPVINDYCNLRCGLTSTLGDINDDFNMDLVIALEMSRLQLIEDEMKKKQCEVEVQASTSKTPAQESCDELAIEDSANKESTNQEIIHVDTAVAQPHYKNKATCEINIENDETSNFNELPNQDLTVDYFLKSLAGQQIDLRNFSNKSLFSPENSSDSELLWSGEASKGISDKDLMCYSFKSCRAEDGRFEIGDIHENGCFSNVDAFNETEAYILKRSHSTGDLCTRGRRHVRLGGTPGSEDSRYHLDSDHSSQHDEKPEDIMKRILAFPASGRTVTEHHSLLMHHNSTGSTSNTGEETSATNSEDGNSIYFGGQSSMEDNSTTATYCATTATISTADASATYSAVTTTFTNNYGITYDSINDDLEVCDILGITVEDNCKARSLGDHNSPLLIPVNKLVEHNVHKSSQCNISLKGGMSSTVTSDTLSVDSLIDDNDFQSLPRELTPSHSESVVPHVENSKSCGSGGLRIKICKSPRSFQNKIYTFDTDSSNEYESETGIPKSPTLFISGVSISRTPEPCSPGLASAVNGRTSRSSSFVVSSTSGMPSASLNSSNASLNTTLLGLSTSPESQTAASCMKLTRNSTFTPPPLSLIYSPNSPVGTTSPRSIAPSPVLTPGMNNVIGSFFSVKSKSASEPERDREMFCFPKSSTDGALSSVLHVQESNLSSDDFHEALFLLEHSPKRNGSSKRRKKSKKERHKEKENSDNTIVNSVKVPEVKEASSAL